MVVKRFTWDDAWQIVRTQEVVTYLFFPEEGDGLTYLGSFQIIPLGQLLCSLDIIVNPFIITCSLVTKRN